MPTDLYLAMTGAEMTSNTPLPPRIGWLACHFSPSGPGLSNLPKALPPRSLLILDDSTPFSGHDPEVIREQLKEVISILEIDSVLLDFQRPKDSTVAYLTQILQTALPCPVAAPADYGTNDSPIFLPPCPPNQLLSEYLIPFRGREIWLEAALNGIRLTITEKGCSKETITFPNVQDFPHVDERLHSHYCIEQVKDSLIFSLQRTRDDLQGLLNEAEHMGVTRAVGLWQELKK